MIKLNIAIYTIFFVLKNLKSLIEKFLKGKDNKEKMECKGGSGIKKKQQNID